MSFVDETTPTARALLVLEMVQNSPGIRGDQLAGRLGMTDRAVRRYVGNLREAGIPVESTRGKYGGYRIGRGMRLAPLMFTAPEALELVMAVLEGRQTDPADPVGQAVAKIIRVLPNRSPSPSRPCVSTSERTPDGHSTPPDLKITAALVTGSAPTQEAAALVPPPARQARRPWTSTRGRSWCGTASGTSSAGRTPPTRAASCASTASPTSPSSPETFEPPADLDPVAAIEEHLSQGWRHKIEVDVEAPIADGEVLDPAQAGPAHGDRRAHDQSGQHRRARLVRRAAGGIPAPFRVVKPAALREQVAVVGRRMLANAGGGTDESGESAGSGPA